MKHSRLAAIVVGGSGRTGGSVVEMLRADRRFTLSGIVDPAADVADGRMPVPVFEHMSQIVGPVDVVIDFSLPAGTTEACGFCVGRKCPLVTGTTGLTGRQELVLSRAAKKIPIVKAANTSRGAHMVFALCELLRGLVPLEADIEIVEKHHRWKRDIPSGTALEIATILSKSRGTGTRRPIRVGRKRGGSVRKGREICIHSIRAGDVIGEHRVDISWNDESLEMTHRVRSRAAFARGAVEAAFLISGRRPGMYSIAQLLAGVHA